MHPSPETHSKGIRRLRPIALGLFTLAAASLAFAQASAPATTGTTDQSKATPTPAQVTTTATTAPAATAEQPIVMQEFTVTSGYASSLLVAEQSKQASNAVTETIAPEDLGKLPYVSIADALASLTGLASQRTNGRDQMISIRGLGPDYQVGTMDGVEQATTNDNRGVEYDQYPAELVAGVTVFKTGQADMVGGIGGTIDLQTVSPLEAEHRVVALNAFYNWTQFKQLTPGVKQAGESYTVSYIDKFLNGTEGVYLGYSHTENPYQMEQFQGWGPPYPGADSAGDLIIGGEKVWVTTDLLTRDSVIGVLESQPNDSIHSKIDIMYTFFKEDELMRGMEIPMAEWSAAQLQPGYTVTNGLVSSYTLKNVQPVNRNMADNHLDHMMAAIWNLDLAEKSSWPVHFTSGWSSVTRSEEVLEEYSGLGFNGGATDADTMQVTQTSGNIPQIVSATNYANPSTIFFTDPQGWGVSVLPVTGMEGYLKYFKERDIVDSLKLSTKHNIDGEVFKDVEIGMSWTERFKQQGQNPSGYLYNADGAALAPLPPIIGTANLSFAGNMRTLAFDPVAAVNNGTLKVYPNPNPGNFWGDNFKVWEEITRPYVQVDMKGTMFGMPYDGNFGCVVDFANQNSSGFSGNGSTIIYPVTGGASYVDFLPSLNLIFRPTKETDIRLSVGRQEARPPMYDMRAARDYGYNPSLATSLTASPWSGTVGNPAIRPWVSDSVDLSLEHYFDNGGGYISIAAFYKQLESYIYQQSTVSNFQGYPYTGSAVPILLYGITNEFVNGSGGNVEGLEVTMQLTSEYVTKGAVKGFGVVVNGSLTDSNIQPWGPGNGNAPLNNLSKKVGNITLYYEAHGFSARVSENYRSSTREYITTFGVPTPYAAGTSGDGYSVEIPEKTIAAQVSYAFRSGFMKGVTVYLEGTNLNNEPLITYYNNDPRQILNWQKYGASYKTGISYKF